MEFDKSRVYTALNADELRAGDKVIVGTTIAEIRDFIEEKVGSMKCYAEILKILPDNCEERFCIGENDAVGEICFPLAYLVERKENCTNCSHSCKSINPCLRYEPKTERAEKHYRPFANTDELIKVWLDKGGKWQKRELTMPLIWVRRKEANTKGQLITEFGDGWGVGIGRGEAYNMTDLWVHFTFLDGSVCGVEE